MPGLGQGFRISGFEFIKLCFSIYLSLIQRVTCFRDGGLLRALLYKIQIEWYETFGRYIRLAL